MGLTITFTCRDKQWVHEVRKDMILADVIQRDKFNSGSFLLEADDIEEYAQTYVKKYVKAYKKLPEFNVWLLHERLALFDKLEDALVDGHSVCVEVTD